ncbi:HPF/RaiA family ribosome-associated protein [Phenylobacterium sp. LjRoot219]|uniref:HPF/RaiA family ribosome-associated protein n=1 Tax=Phenylobacterium sp. LjRoot219 TaxID=3342283 RepID=UPI003ECD3754
MQVPLQITFEGGLAGSDSLRRRIEREAAKLERFYDRISSCRVAVTGRGGKRRQGGLYAVRLQVTGPGLGDMVITRNPPADHAHEDAFVAVRDAFAAARRRLLDRHGRHTGKAKAHETATRGELAPIFRQAAERTFERDDAELDQLEMEPLATAGRTARVAYA